MRKYTYLEFFTLYQEKYFSAYYIPHHGDYYYFAEIKNINTKKTSFKFWEILI